MCTPGGHCWGPLLGVGGARQAPPCDSATLASHAAGHARRYRALSLQLHPDRAGGSTEAFARVAAAHDCLSDAECRAQFDEGSEIEGFEPSFAEAVERHFFKERFPFEPFGDPFENLAAEGSERRARFRRRQWSNETQAPAADPSPGPEIKDEV